MCEATECIIWRYFINQGYTPEQTAGIMGNLMQEHGLQTDGDGIAQWLGGRLEGLLQRGDPYSLQTQLDYIIYELNNNESEANIYLKSSTTIEEATINFQNKYERCNPYWCMQYQRINYAYGFYNKLKE